MAPFPHFLASWLIAAKTTNNARDCRLVTLAGVLPDADGLGLVADGIARWIWSSQTFFYERYHHFLLHGLFGGILIALTLACGAWQRQRVGVLVLLVFHLHLLCDLLGSRGPAPIDRWPIFYFGPLAKGPMWSWKGQWALDACPNRLISLALFAWTLRFAAQKGHSFVGVLSKRLDRVFVGRLQRWCARWGRAKLG